MRTDKERNLLLKALDTFNRKIVVISKEFRILASAGVDELVGGQILVGQALPPVVLPSPRTLRKLSGQKGPGLGQTLSSRPFNRVLEQAEKSLPVCLSLQG